MPLFDASRLEDVTDSIFRAVGAPDPVARRVAHALIDANLAGHDSHGVIRIPSYVQAVQQGEVLPAADAEIVKETAVSAVVDGGWGFGQVTAEKGTRLAVDKAREHGLAAVAMVRCNHIGRLGEYSEMAAAAGTVAFVAAGGFGGRGARAVPFGGRQGLFGTNPLSFGLPGADSDVVLVDFATTAVAAGKIQLARAKGAPLPPGSIIDKDGNPTTDAGAFYDGGWLLPFGGHKGYGLSLVVELLGRVLTGADEYAQDGRGGPVHGRSGTLVIALDAGLFRDRDAYAAGVAETLRQVKAVPPAPQFAEVLVPGEPESRTRADRLKNGVYVEDATEAAIRQVAGALGVDTAPLAATP